MLILQIAGLPLVEDVDKSIDVEQINDQYFERMAKSGEFGDGTILAAACRLFHRLINVVLIDKRVIKFAPPGYDLNNAGSPLWLGFIQDGKHYVKLSPKLPTNTVDSSPQAGTANVIANVTFVGLVVAVKDSANNCGFCALRLFVCF